MISNKCPNCFKDLEENDILKFAPGGIHICHLSHPIHLSWFSDGLCKLLGYTREEMNIKLINPYDKKLLLYLNLIHPDDHRKFFDFCVYSSKNMGSQSVEYRMIKKNNEVIHVLDTMESYVDQNNIIRGFSSVTDISFLKEIESNHIKKIEDLNKKANYDNLTHLYNKTSAFEIINYLLSQNCKKRNLMFVIDLDNFKSINDSLGHTVGDYLLVDMAKELKKIFRSNDIVARFGGDEFIIFISGLDEYFDIHKKAHQILEAAQSLSGEKYNFKKITTSIGISVSNHLADEQKFFELADKALYEAKRKGRNTYFLVEF